MNVSLLRTFTEQDLTTKNEHYGANGDAAAEWLKS